MGKFVTQIVYIPDEHDEDTKVDAVMGVLNATVVALQERYAEIFGGLDDVIRAVNERAKKDHDELH